MELLTLFGVGVITILGLIAANRARFYKNLSGQVWVAYRLMKEDYCMTVVELETTKALLESANNELLSIKLTHSKLQLLDYVDKPVDGE